MKEILMHSWIEKSFNHFSFRHQVKFFRKKIDFVFIDEEKKIHAVELKIRDWRNAIDQIDTNQLCANFCYLGIWHKYEDHVPKGLLEKYGIGLISVSKKNCIIKLKPKESTILSNKYNNHIRDLINEV